MSESKPEKHPLDDEDITKTWNIEHGSSPTEVFKPLLRPSVAALVAGFVIAFLAGVTASNAQPNSAIESVSSVISHMAAYVMLAGGCGILIAYRIPYFKRISRKKTAIRWFESGFVNLIFVNLAGVVIVWFCLLGMDALSAANSSLTAIFGSAGISVYVALLVTMIVFHTGYLRAYAIGSLTVCPLALYSWMNFAMSLAYSGSMRGRGYNFSVWPYGAFVTFSAFVGLVCASYITLIAFHESHRKSIRGMEAAQPAEINDEISSRDDH